MSAMFKYPLALNSRVPQVIEMVLPANGRRLGKDLEDNPCIWAIAERGRPKVKVLIHTICTGQTMSFDPVVAMSYLGVIKAPVSSVEPSINLIWHVFVDEVVPE